MSLSEKHVEYLVVDTTAFIQNAPLQNVAEKMITCQEVVDEIVNKRQLRRLVVLPYDLEVKHVFPENIRVVTEFSKKTGDYPSLSATDIKIMALTYQLEKEKVGIDHLRTEPVIQRSGVNIVTNQAPSDLPRVAGFWSGNDGDIIENDDEQSDEDNDEVNGEAVDDEKIDGDDVEEPLNPIENNEEDTVEEEDDDDSGWITPSNVKSVKKQVNSALIEEKHVTVACMTTDFAMQNVLKQMNLNVAALDGKMIKQLRTFILRCYACFKTTSIMTLRFCPKCGNDTLKKVAVSLDENGKMQIHINGRRPLTARGKKFSIPRIRGGKHPNNPILVADQPMAENRLSKVAITKVNPLDDDYIARNSPFATRDITSRSAKLRLRPGAEVKHWMRKNPNEARRKRT